MAYLIYNNVTLKQVKKDVDQACIDLKSLIRYLCLSRYYFFTLVIDWVGVGLFAYSSAAATFETTRMFPNYRVLVGIAASILGFHISTVVHLVNSMKNFKFPNNTSKMALGSFLKKQQLSVQMWIYVGKPRL